MATDIKIPQLGESITEAVISSWLKEEGAYVEQDEEIVELETDKVTMPLPAPAAGVLKRGKDEGDTVEVGGVIGAIDESAEKPSGGDGEEQAEEKAGASASEEKEESRSKSESKSGSESESKDTSRGESEREPASASVSSGGGEKASKESSGSGREPEPAVSAGGGGGGDGTRSTPVAQKLAKERGVDLARVRGTGPGGRVREQDVLAYLNSQNGAAGAASEAMPHPAGGDAGDWRTVRRERMSPLRQRIAVRLVEAQQTAAMLTTFNECDMSAVMALRSRYKESFEKKHGVRLGFMSFFVKAACAALEAYPAVNSYIIEGEKGPEVEAHDYCDIAVAVGTPKGLVVPVLRNCERLSFAGIEGGIGELASRARDGKLTLEEMQGGTFTISNGGVYGSMMSTPILNPPQSGILGLHNIVRRPVENPAKPGSGEVAVRPMMYLALSYDHRIVDGEGAVRFLRTIKELIEDPERLLIDV